MVATAAVPCLTCDCLIFLAQFSHQFTDLTYRSNGCGLAAAFDAVGKLFVVVPDKYGVVTGYTRLTTHSLPAYHLSWFVQTRCGVLSVGTGTDRVGLVFSSATASVTQDMLLLSGSGVVTVVNTTTSVVVYTSPYYLSDTVTDGLLTTRGDVVLVGTEGCGPYSGRYCAPSYVTSINLANGARRVQYNVSDTLGPVVLHPQLGVMYIVGYGGNTGFLLGVSLDHRVVRATTRFNLSMPYTFSPDMASISLAVRCADVVDSQVCGVCWEFLSPWFWICVFQVRPQGIQPPFETGFLAVLSYPQFSRTPHSPVTHFLNLSTGEIMRSAVVSPPPFEGYCDVVKFLVVNNNAVVVLQYTSDEVREQGCVQACDGFRCKLIECVSCQNKVVTQVASVPFRGANM